MGLAAAGFGLRWGYRLLELNEIQLPFWFYASVSPETMLYVVALTVLGAVVAGVVPALKVTGKAADARLRQASAGGGGGFRFGGIWTAVIVTQVAATLAFPVPAFFLFRMAVQIQTADVGFAEEEYLSARLEMDRNGIGVRIALGADPKRLAAAVFRRPLRQLGSGIVAGCALVGMIGFEVFDGVSAGGVALLVSYAGLMTGVCMLACIVPTRRALRVEPTEALRADG